MKISLKTSTRLAVAFAVAGSVTAATLQARATSFPAASPDSRAAVVAQWLGLKSIARSAWTLVSDPAGPRYHSHVPGVGLVELDATTQEVTEVIFDDQLHGTTRHVALGDALGTARTFATGHFRGFAGLTQRRATFVDHGVFQEYRVTWQAKQGDAWLPSVVTVGVNSDTGKVAYFSSRRVSVTLASTTPTVSAATAQAAALKVVGSTPATAGEPSLEVVLASAGQRLVWVTEVHGASSKAHAPVYDVVWTDAKTGATTITARG